MLRKYRLAQQSTIEAVSRHLSRSLSAWYPSLARGGFGLLVLALLVPFFAGLPAQAEGRALGHLGLEPGLKADGEVVLQVTPGLTADRAGIQNGSVLLAVDGVAIRAWSMQADLLPALRGPVGSQVTLVVRTTEGELRHFVLSRGAIGLDLIGWAVEDYSRLIAVLDLILLLGFLVPAAIIYLRGGREPLASLAAVVLVIFALGNTSEYVALLVDHPRWVYLLRIFAALYTALSLAFVYLFPNGSFFPRWTRYPFYGGLVFSALLLSPFPYHPFAWPYLIGNLINLGFYVLAIAAQIVRYRRSSSFQQRQQTKWILFGLTVAVAAVFAFGLPQFILPELQNPTPLYFQYQLIGRPVTNLLLMILPLTFLISIMRYRLYDIDLIINRTLVYVPLSAMVAGVIAGSMTLSQKLFLAFTGSDTIAATALAALIVVTLMTPVKERLQKMVDRHFKEWPDPGERLRIFTDEVRARLFPMESAELGRRLLEEAVLAFQADGGLLQLQHAAEGTHRLQTRHWRGESEIRVPLMSRDSTDPIGYVALARRRQQAGYTSYDRELLEGVAKVVAQAMEEDGSSNREQ